MGPGETVHVLMHSLALGTLKPLIPPLREDGSPGAREDAIDPAQMDMTLNVMAHSLVWWTQDLVAQPAGRGSRIFSMTSEGSHRGAQLRCGLGSQVVAGVAHPAARDGAGPRGILVNCIQAGVTDTPALRKIPGNEKMIETTLRRNPAAA